MCVHVCVHASLHCKRMSFHSSLKISKGFGLPESIVETCATLDTLTSLKCGATGPYRTSD